MRIFSIDLWYASNNEVELTVVKQGLEKANREQYNKLEIEGDSAMLTGVIRKLQQGVRWEHINKN